MIESEFQDEIQVELRRRGAYCRSLVGNMLQSGLPDMLVISPYGFVFHVENKVWNKPYAPNCKEDFVKLLEGAQVNVITNEFWGRKAFCPILAFDKRNVGRLAYLYDNASNTIVKNDWMKFVEFFVSLKQSY